MALDQSDDDYDSDLNGSGSASFLYSFYDFILEFNRFYRIKELKGLVPTIENKKSLKIKNVPKNEKRSKNLLRNGNVKYRV